MSNKLLHALERGCLRGLGPVNIKAGLEKLSDEDLKKILSAIRGMLTARREAETRKRISQARSRLTPRKVADLLKMALDAGEWDFRTYDFYKTNEGAAIVLALDGWLGEGTAEKLEDAFYWYFYDSDTYRKFSPILLTRQEIQGVDKCYSDAEETIKGLIEQLEAL